MNVECQQVCSSKITKGGGVVSNCAFCDRKNLEERIIAENDNLYVVATLGQITEGGHVLVLPKKHLRCMGEMPKEDLPGFAKCMDLVSKALAFEYSVPRIGISFFEHGIVGQTIPHAHVHIVPARMYFSEQVKKDFPSCRHWTYSSWEEVLHYFKKTQKPYILRKRSPGVFDVLWDPPAEAQYLRTVLAKSLGVPNRANWRLIDPEADKVLWSETVRRLKPHFKNL